MLALPYLGIDGFWLTPPQQPTYTGDVSGDLAIALVIFGAGFLLLGVLNLAFGIGAVAQRGWAWPVGAVLQGLNLMFNVVDWIEHGLGPAALLNFVLALVVLWQLSQPNIRAAFGRDKGPWVTV